MRIAPVLALAWPLLGVPPASAQVIDVSTIKCEDFVKSPKETIGNLMMWLSAYYMKDGAQPVINFDDMVSKGKNLGEHCVKNPTVGLITAADVVMKAK